MAEREAADNRDFMLTHIKNKKIKNKGQVMARGTRRRR